MISYCIRLFKQISRLYKIKTHLDKITLGITTNETEIIQQQNFESLKLIIFENGSLYIKFFQWYISKLKANIINNNTIESQNTIKFIKYFEDIFEQCPYHDLEHTKAVFTESTSGIDLEDYIDISTFKPATITLLLTPPLLFIVNVKQEPTIQFLIAATILAAVGVVKVVTPGNAPFCKK